ncbi:MAG: methionyl-tRNA formyltransferase [Candidatus Omnitrophica bacterium]|nr:methionyl-tRNA formyltransferase [Candidatus Omnitrophota bacterium]
MRVIFFGTSEFAVPSLERLAASSHTMVMCVTQPDRPQGRGLDVTPSPVKRAAVQRGLPLIQPERLDRHVVESAHPDIGVVVAYGRLIQRELLEWPAHGMLGIHPSLLPKYRGAAPVAWALLNGETLTGVTIFRLNERVDAGEIVSQQTLPIAPQENADTLTRRLAQLGAGAVLSAVEQIAAGRARFAPQDEASASLAPKLTKAQGRIDWQASAEQIERLVRATVPWPGATVEWRGVFLKLRSVSVNDPRARKAAPGTIVQVEPSAVTVATGQGTLAIREVQPAGRRRMSIKEFLAGHPVTVGEIFGGVA